MCLFFAELHTLSKAVNTLKSDYFLYYIQKSPFFQVLQ
nr:MAG TPA: hypothetical protein [Caudoviricetes sp.]